MALLSPSRRPPPARNPSMAGRMAVSEESRPMTSALSSIDEETADSLAGHNGNGHTLAPAPKTTAQKIEEFYGVKQVGDEVIFAAHFEAAKKVLIAGDFNNWSPMSTPMINKGRPAISGRACPFRRAATVIAWSWMANG